jgi:hypothetical protein
MGNAAAGDAPAAKADVMDGKRKGRGMNPI